MSRYPYTSHPLRDDPDADGLLPKPDADFASCKTCGKEFSKTVLLGGLCPKCATKFMRLNIALSHYNEALDATAAVPISDARAENLAAIAAGHGYVCIAREIRTAIYHLNHLVDDLSSDSKTDCLKPAACRAGAGAGK
jgi:predicted Zn-ribbon and HTH transcriptional regulator